MKTPTIIIIPAGFDYEHGYVAKVVPLRDYESLAARLNYKPTDADVRAWVDRHGLEGHFGSSVEAARCAIEDAQSIGSISEIPKSRP